MTAVDSSRGPFYAPVARPRIHEGIRGPMQGLMQDRPLTLPHFFARAEQLFPDKGIVTATAAGKQWRSYGEWADRTRRLGGVLDDARHLRRRPGGHLRLEHGPPPRAVLRRPVHAAGCCTPSTSASSPSSSPTSPTTPRTRSSSSTAPSPPAVAAARHVHDRPPRRGHGRRRPGDVPEAARGHEVHDYEELLAGGRARSSSTSTTRTRPRPCATRAAPPATPRASSTRHRSTFLHTMGVHDRRQPRRAGGRP